MTREMEDHQVIINGMLFNLQDVEVNFNRQSQHIIHGVHYFNRGQGTISIKAFSVEGEAEINISGTVETLKRIITPSPRGHLKRLFDAN